MKEALFGRVIGIGENEDFHCVTPMVIEFGVLDAVLIYHAVSSLSRSLSLTMLSLDFKSPHHLCELFGQC
jgi:hypothetical protein